MILATAITHFEEDIIRSKALLQHANGLPNSQLKQDVFRSAWMIAVGALDAYFCDAYGDLVARTFRAKKNQATIDLPPKLKNLKIPATVVLNNHLNDGWFWRMIARDLIEKDNVLSIQKIKDLFNHFFQPNEKLFIASTNPIERWILHGDSKVRMFGINRTKYRNPGVGISRISVKKDALKHLESRFALIFQRRHDCIHNCDRPKIAVQTRNINGTYIAKVINDIEFLVYRCTEELRGEFPSYLARLGCTPITRNAVGA